MHKKNLDNLFQEKFKDFSETPDEKVWQSIEAALDEKEKSRKVIPLWWKLGGVAAVLAIAVWIINPFGDAAAVGPTVTDIEKTDTENTKENLFENQDPVDEILVDTEEETSSEDEIISEKEDAYTKVTTEKPSIPEDKIDANSVAKTKSKKVGNDAVQVTSSEQKNIPEKNDNNKLSNTVLPETTTDVAVIQNSDSKTTKTDVNAVDTDNSAQVTDATSEDKNIEKANTLLSNNTTKIDDALAQTDAGTTKIDNEKAAEKTTTVTEKEEYIAQVDPEKAAETAKEQQKKSIFDEIAAQEEEETVAENDAGKWSAGPSVAPVYFNAIGEGSPLHSIFVPNSKSGNTNLSYGLTVAYEINPKLSIRSGVHKVDYGYRTNDVEFASSSEIASNRQIDNINYSATAKNLVLVSNARGAVSNDAVENFVPTALDVSASSTAQNGVMSQQFGYLEVPVELEYALVDKKIGVNVIGGVSSLFLIDNSISLTSGELTTDVGEANNVNNLNFSANAGIGINYKFTPKVRLNIEPVFKYQLNTFSETDGTFQPFSVGVYSGLTFKF